MSATVPPASEDSAEQRRAALAAVDPAGPGDVDAAVRAVRGERREIGSAGSREAVGERTGGAGGGEVDAAAPATSPARGDQRPPTDTGDRGGTVEGAPDLQAPPGPAPVGVGRRGGQPEAVADRVGDVEVGVVA